MTICGILIPLRFFTPASLLKALSRAGFAAEWDGGEDGSLLGHVYLAEGSMVHEAWRVLKRIFLTFSKLVR